MLWRSGAQLSAPAEKRSENEIDRVAEEALGWAGLGWAGLGWAGLETWWLSNLYCPLQQLPAATFQTSHSPHIH